MGREVRRVTKDWQHPKKPDGRYQPLFDGSYYRPAADEWLKSLSERGLQATLDDLGPPPDQQDYMPDWSEAEADHLMMYEDTSEGTPISPAFKTPEELARWLADTGASTFGDDTATYEQWLATVRLGFAVCAVGLNGELISGVAFNGSRRG